MTPIERQNGQTIKTKVYAICFAVAALVLFLHPGVSALTLSTSRDCTSNAIVNCGALSVNELQQKYNDQPAVHTIYHNFGITHVDIANMDANTVEGRVTAGGRVLINDSQNNNSGSQVVATDVVTAGMQNMTGSSKQTANGVTFYTRPPSVSFQQSSLPAFVVMKNGQFQYAIIASCGNPVKATPVVKKAAMVTHTTVAPPVTPPPVVQTQTVYVPTPVQVVNPVAHPVPVPTPVAVPTPQPVALPNTGVGDLVGFGSFVTLLSGAGHFLYKRKFIS